MAGNPHPFYQNNIAVDKSAARGGTAITVGTIDELRNLDGATFWVVFVLELNSWFSRNTADTTSADTGYSVIVGPNGERWRRMSDANSGSAIVHAANGETFETGVIITDSARRIRNIYQTPAASTVTVEFFDEHDYQDGDTVSVRPGGWDSISLLRHCAFGEWEVSIVSPTTLVLNGSTWSASKFLHGYTFLEDDLIDAAPVLIEANSWAASRGGGFISLPAGFIFVLSGDDTVSSVTAISFPSNIEWCGKGENATCIATGDYLNRFLLQVVDSSNVTIRDLTTFGNRQAQANGGYHSVRVGNETDDNENITFMDMSILGSPGYGSGWQGDRSMRNCRMIRVKIIECDSDGTDWKNRNSNNEGNTFDTITFKYCGLFEIGTDFAAVTTLGADPIATVSGSSIVTITQNPRPNGGVTISDALEVAGITLQGSYRVVDRPTGTTYTIDSGQVANATTTGGGSNVKVRAPAISAGDAYCDLRGHVLLSNIYCFMDFWSTNGIDAQTGTAGESNGEGAFESVFSNIQVKHLGEYWNGGTAGMTVGGEDLRVEGIVVDGTDSGVYALERSRRCTIRGTVKNAARGFRVQGEIIDLTSCLAFRCSTAGFIIGGTTLNGNDLLDANPFTTTSASATVSVRHVLHGFATSQSVTFAGATTFNGVTISGAYTVTVVDGDNYTITASGAASASGAGGGSAVTAAYTINPHLIYGINLTGAQAVACTKGYEVSANVVSGQITIALSSAIDCGTSHTEATSGSVRWIQNIGLPSNSYIGSAGFIDFASNNVRLAHANNELRLSFGGTVEYIWNAAVFYPAINGGATLGTASFRWAGLHLDTNAVINFVNGDVTITHATNTLAFAGASLGYTFDAAISVNGSTVALLGTEDQILTGGFRVTSKDLGTITTGTLTLDPGDRALQHAINGGAFTLAPGSNTGSILLDITNNGSAGAITTSGWTKVVGAFDTVNGNKFRCHASIGQGGSLLTIQEMQ
jgi:hypothetical protein